MKRSCLFYYFWSVFCVFVSLLKVSAQVSEIDSIILPGENNKVPALNFSYFPSRMHTFIWRNWTVVPVVRIAEVLNTSEENVKKVAFSMGLPKQPPILPEWSTSRGYITVLRRNWHLLPYKQILQLLGMTRQELSWRLIEDDFLIIKLGTKPFCESLSYVPPTTSMELRAYEISKEIKALGNGLFKGEQPRFNFIHEYNKVKPSKRVAPKKNETGFALRLIFSYFTDYGDSLIDPNLSSYPEGLLQELAEMGVNGIWIHSVLRMLVPPDGIFPGEEDYLQRINGLKRLVDRASKYGIGIYLYANEPRGMSASFFKSKEERMKLGGVKEGDMQAFCTSEPEVLNWLSCSFEKVFHEVPGLAGVFTITASENLTSCVSHNGQDKCPKCNMHSYADLLVDVNTAIVEGVKKGNPEANVLVWDWGWRDDEAEEIINRLPKCCWLMSVSEWSLPIERGGIKSAVGEYSLSAVGPGPRALQHWEYAKQAGLKTIAKVQVNSSWEMAIVPAVPVMDLVAEHAENLEKVSMDGVMLSWSLGGFPSLNLDLFQSMGVGKKEELLDSFACVNYGKEITPFIRKAWTCFSNAFKEYPYSISTLYSGPQHMGPSNPLFVSPSEYKATMVGFPYDDLVGWCTIYPVDIWISQMNKVAEGFNEGCKILREAYGKAPKLIRPKIYTDLLRAEAVRIHCLSCASQAAFVDLRNRYLATEDKKKKKDCLVDMYTWVYKEQENVKSMLPIVKEDPTIGYESSNQYFYLPIDLVEKYINLNAVLKWLQSEEKQTADT